MLPVDFFLSEIYLFVEYRKKYPNSYMEFVYSYNISWYKNVPAKRPYVRNMYSRRGIMPVSAQPAAVTSPPTTTMDRHENLALKALDTGPEIMEHYCQRPTNAIHTNLFIFLKKINRIARALNVIIKAV